MFGVEIGKYETESLEVLGSKDVLVVLSLASVSGGNFHRFCIVHNVWAIQTVCVGGLQNGLLRGCQVVVHRGRPPTALVTEITAAIDMSGGRKSKEGGPALFGARPFLFFYFDQCQESKATK